jgi:RNA polymerase sigma-70 factor (ECF subfamily)
VERFEERALMVQADEDLIRRIRKRDTNAFEVLFTRYEGMVRQHLVCTVHDEDTADDLVQEVFLRVWTHAGQWDGRGTFRMWLFRIATNLALNHLRSVRRRRQQPFEIPVDENNEEDEHPTPAWMVDTSLPRPDVVLEQTEQHQLLRQLIEELPEEKREVFRLVYEAEMEIRDVADTLGIPEGTVKSRLHYATKRLAQEWREIAGEGEE